MLSPRHRRFATLALLYVSQAVPLGFFIVAIPAILRAEGLSLERVGLLAALAFPWLIKFLWAPLVDRFGSSRGHYRSWILPLQAGCIVAVIGIASLDLGRDVGALVATGALFMLLSATQDVATDGLAVRWLEAGERGIGNGIQVGGYYLGQILGGGLVLVLYARYGWTFAVGSMAAVLALPLLPVWAMREPSEPPAARERVGFRSLVAFFRRAGILPWVGVLLLWRAGETMALSMFNPMLVDQGYSLETIGVTLGVVVSIGALLGATVGGASIARLGRRRALRVFGLLLAVALLGYAIPAVGRGGMPAVWASAAIVAFGGGLATAALYTSMMDRSSAETAGTDFTLQQSLAAIGPLTLSSVSGFSAATLGYAGHFVAAAAVQVAAVLLVAVALRRAILSP
jgi:RhtX/FptX family siderophore transporter